MRPIYDLFNGAFAGRCSRITSWLRTASVIQILIMSQLRNRASTSALGNQPSRAPPQPSIRPSRSSPTIRRALSFSLLKLHNPNDRPQSPALSARSISVTSRSPYSPATTLQSASPAVVAKKSSPSSAYTLALRSASERPAYDASHNGRLVPSKGKHSSHHT